MRYAMAIDTRKCVGCSDCTIACNNENNVSGGYSRSWIVEMVRGKYPETTMVMQSERCNHCDNAPCVRCCPTGASYIAEGGVVMVDPRKCIGCAACVEACPYDARYMNSNGVADKCTFCNHRVEDGLNPACVDVCPTNCMYFGDIEDPQSEIARLLRERTYNVLTPEAGTKPQVYYLT